MSKLQDIHVFFLYSPHNKQNRSCLTSRVTYYCVTGIWSLVNPFETGNCYKNVPTTMLLWSDKEHFLFWSQRFRISGNSFKVAPSLYVHICEYIPYRDKRSFIHSNGSSILFRSLNIQLYKSMLTFQKGLALCLSRQ